MINVLKNKFLYLVLLATLALVLWAKTSRAFECEDVYVCINGECEYVTVCE